MLGLGLDISTIALSNQALQRGIPQPYVTESSNQYVTEDGLNSYTTEG